MSAANLAELFVRPLEDAGLTYLVAGSVASIHYGEPRSTLDIDLVVSMHANQIPLLISLFSDAAYYVPPEEVIAVELVRAAFGHFNILHPESGLKADIYPARGNKLFAWALENRRRDRILGVEAWISPPEYVILWKLKYFQEGGSSKHISDIKGIIAVQGEKLDQAWITERAKEEHVSEEWLECLKEP